jgi:cytochrome c556
MRFRMKVLAVAVATSLVVYLGSSKAEDKPVDIKGCMGSQNKVRELAKAKTIDWDEVGPKVKTWLTAAEDLGKNKPPRGDDKSWKELCDKYLTNVKAVDEAAEKKDGPALNKSLATIQGTCMGCHSKHRPPKN